MWCSAFGIVSVRTLYKTVETYGTAATSADGAAKPVGLRCLVHRVARCNRAGTAIEFAFVATALIPVILFVMIAGLILYFAQTLDYATSRAARQIMIGAVQKAGTTQSAFQTQVCSYLPATFNCANVIVNVQTATEAMGPGGYYTFVNSNQTSLLIPTLSNTSTQFSPGLQGSYVYIQVIYPITFFPKMFSVFFGTTTYQNAPAYLVVSTAAFRNEQY